MDFSDLVWVVVVVVVLTLTRIIKSVVTGQAPVTLELRSGVMTRRKPYQLLLKRCRFHMTVVTDGNVAVVKRLTRTPHAHDHCLIATFPRHRQNFVVYALLYCDTDGGVQRYRLLRSRAGGDVGHAQDRREPSIG